MLEKNILYPQMAETMFQWILHMKYCVNLAGFQKLIMLCESGLFCIQAFSQLLNRCGLFFFLVATLFKREL